MLFVALCLFFIMTTLFSLFFFPFSNNKLHFSWNLSFFFLSKYSLPLNVWNRSTDRLFTFPSYTFELITFVFGVRIGVRWINTLMKKPHGENNCNKWMCCFSLCFFFFVFLSRVTTQQVNKCSWYIKQLKWALALLKVGLTFYGKKGTQKHHD